MPSEGPRFRGPFFIDSLADLQHTRRRRTCRPSTIFMNSKLLLILLTLLLSSVSAIAQGKLKTYKDTDEGFTVSYESPFKVVTTPVQVRSDTAFGDPGMGIKLLKVMPRVLARKYHGWYEFNVWKSTEGDSNCGEPRDDDGSAAIPLGPVDKGVARTLKLSGQTFYGYSGSEGGMSKSVEILGYRGMINGACWQIQELTYQVSAFSDFKQFDRKKIRKEFLAFLDSFKFLSV